MSQTEGSSTHPAPLANAIELVRLDHEHGASWLARQVAQALAEASRLETSDGAVEDRLHQIHQAARAFAESRPSMAALANTAARIWQAGAPSTTITNAPQTRLARIHSEAARLVAIWHDASDAIFTTAHPLLNGRLFTLSHSSTVEYTLVRIAQMGSHRQQRLITIGESRPGAEGVVAAGVLAGAGWQVTLIPDAAYALFITETDAVVLGADSIRADGSVINKVGSHLLALAAHAAGVPVYVLCETLKIAATDMPLTLEEMDPSEILAQSISGVTPRNIYFERVPARLITGILTERGRLSRDEIAAIATEATQAQIALTDPTD